MRFRLFAVAGLAVCAALLVVGCGGGGGGKPRPDLIFVSTKSGVYDIYAMNADGSRQARLTHGKTGNATSGLFYASDPSWSRDGRRIAFWSTRLGQPRLFVMDANGQNARALSAAPVPSAQPSWSPDGTRIVFVSGSASQLEIVNADGTGAHRVTSSPLQVVKETNPSWSPDGRWIAYVETETGRPIKEIWLVHPDGTSNHQLTNLQASTGNPAWSPNSKQLVFSSDVKGGHYGIYTASISGGQPPAIVSLTTIDEIDPSWSPDGKRIAYSRDGAIVTVNPDGSNEKVITGTKENDSSPVWNPIAAPPKSLKKTPGY